MKRPVVGVTLIGLFLLTATARLSADVTLPSVFSDHMVLQRDLAVPVWGWAEPNEQVTVEFAGQKKSATADAKGKWMLKLDPMPASAEPRELTVSSANPNSKIQTPKLADVLVGEVWLCSGQSNMAMTVNRANDFDKEKEAAKFPLIRMFREASSSSPEPQEKGNGSWTACTPETVGGFSATGYFFGRQLHQKLNIPVGLLHSSVGGTPIEAWTSLEVQKDLPELKPLFQTWAQRQAAYDPETAVSVYLKMKEAHKAAVEKAKAEGKPSPKAPQKPRDPRTESHYPGNLYNGKIANLIPFAIRGAIWYQGESNAFTVEGGTLYAQQLALMIKDWRNRWNQGDFPFAWVQLPNYRSDRFAGWCEVRESMLKCLSLPNTGMAIAIDLGEPKDIHPKNKQEVGRRLALWALAKVYSQAGPVSGPLPAGHEIKGSDVICSFKCADGGLVAKDGELKGFEIAGADKKWVKATAKIDGEKVIVSSPEVKEPVAARYAWADDPTCNLCNGAGLPASPFRTSELK